MGVGGGVPLTVVEWTDPWQSKTLPPSPYWGQFWSGGSQGWCFCMEVGQERGRSILWLVSARCFSASQMRSNGSLWCDTLLEATSMFPGGPGFGGESPTYWLGGGGVCLDVTQCPQRWARSCAASSWQGVGEEPTFGVVCCFNFWGKGVISGSSWKDQVPSETF